MKRHKYLLDEDQIPSHYYNVIPDLPEPPPEDAPTTDAPEDADGGDLADKDLHPDRDDGV